MLVIISKLGWYDVKKYFNYQVTRDVTVQDLITIETLDIKPDFSYPEELHEFYEFAYVDSGRILCRMDSETVELCQGEFFLIPPRQAHFYLAVKDQPAVIFIVCFRSNSDCLTILDHKLMLNRDEKHILSDMMKEAREAFVFPFDKMLRPTPAAVFGAQQMVENNLEKLLIHLIRAQISRNKDIVFVMDSIELENSLCNELVHLLKSHVFDALTLDQISAEAHYSKTYLNAMFRRNMGQTIMKYYTTLKIKEAKTLLRSGLPVETIAARLKFESPTYFTKVFKKYTNMTPTAYKRTIL